MIVERKLARCFCLCHCNDMRATVTEGSSAKNFISRRNRTASFAEVLDGRKQPVRGLWRRVRNGRFYGQLSVENPTTGQQLNRPLAPADAGRKTVVRL